MRSICNRWSIIQRSYMVFCKSICFSNILGRDHDEHVPRFRSDARDVTNELRVRSTAREMWIAAGVLATLSAAANMASPLYPTYQQALGISDLAVTLLYATYALASVPSLLLFGPAADAFGRKPVLALGVTCAAIGTLPFAVAEHVAWLFAGRLLLGVALGLATGAGVAMMIEREPSGNRARGSLLATLSFIGGTGAGPLLTGVLAQYAPAPTVLPFVVMLAVLLAVGVSLAWVPGGVLVRGQRWRPTRPSVPHHLRTTFVVAGTTGFLGWAVVGIFLALLPSVAESVLGRPNLAVTGAIIAALLLCSALAQPLAPRLLPHAAQTLGVTMIAVALGLLVSSYLPMFAQTPASLVLLISAAVTAGMGHGMSYWGAAADVDARTSEHRAAVTASLYLLFYLGAGLPAVGVGLLTMILSLGTAVLLFSLVVALVTVLFLPVPSLVQTQIFATAPVPGPPERDRVREGATTGSAFAHSVIQSSWSHHHATLGYGNGAGSGSDGRSVHGSGASDKYGPDRSAARS
ncbi:MFS transporter [Actinobacteria bacterium YIM 96077]|uniref:MFS transporter n=1 Tax=Phytoactinopolyspora halophila TaxID=1981511 RepID=A0A329QYD2_9ACTN|nr:MFS transporter [Actinobacteria bacterium YIM 96077]RAW15648.1 MFS transporter [Phytoactinopolyspora halophila]